jgi:hypothetical protein
MRSRSLVARDDADVEAEARADLVQEPAAVVRLAQGAGRDRQHRLGLVALDDRNQLGQRQQRGRPRRFRERAGPKDRLADPGHPLGAIDHLEVAVPGHVHDQRVERVGT